jgi:hypothetical protein
MELANVDQNCRERGLLEQKIATSMEELNQLHQKPTLDDFQDFWRGRLEFRLLELRQELRDLLEKERIAIAGPLPVAI